MEHSWGHSRIVLEQEDVLVVVGEATGGDAASSLHYHAFHHHTLLVVRGLCLLSYPDSRGVFHWQPLYAGESETIPAGMRHRLKFPQPTKFIECYMRPLRGTYHSAVSVADIVRVAPGWGAGERRADVAG